MSDAESLIERYVEQMPDYAKDWCYRRITRQLNKTGQLPDQSTVIGVADYLSSLDSEHETYRKLNRISWNDAVWLQEKWHEAIARKAAKMKELEGDPSGDVVVECEDGYKWIVLKTPEQLNFEGNMMGHCIGNGNYDKSGNAFYSLRDQNNAPHVTVEFNQNGNDYIQICGKANQSVGVEYWNQVWKLFGAIGTHNGLEIFSAREYCIVSEGQIYFEDDAQNIIDKGLPVDDYYLHAVSCGLATNGRLYLLNNDNIPSDVIFQRVKLCADSTLEEWKWDVLGNFDAYYATNLKAIAKHVKFGGDVCVAGTSISHWQNDVEGDFHAYESKFKTVSATVRFGGNVDIRKTKAAHWTVDVYGCFDARGSSLKTVELHVIFADVAVDDTNIEYWSNEVEGTFSALGTPLKEISENVRIAGCVSVEDGVIRGDLKFNQSLMAPWA